VPPAAHHTAIRLRYLTQLRGAVPRDQL
jgi:hypothetical protein